MARPWMTIAITSALPAATVKQGDDTESVPLISIFRTVLKPWPGGLLFGDAPGWEYPSIQTGSTMSGRGDESTMV